MKQYKYKDRIYSVVNCSYDDIPSHVERVSSYWPVEVREGQVNLLKECVERGMAKQVINDKNITQAVIYCLPVRDTEVTSHLLWAKGKRMLAILAWYLRVHLDIAKIYFMPHSKDFIPFEFMVEPYSIRSFHSHNTPLLIDLFTTKNREFGYALIRDGIVQEI